MEVNDHHRYLFLGKITGTLTESEERELQDVFSDNIEARLAYEALVDRLPSGGVQESFKYLNKPGFWEDLPRKIHQEQGKRRRKVVFSIASALTIISAIIFLVEIFNRNQGPTQPIPALVKQEKRLVLKLANGKSVNLTEAKGTINVEGLALQNENEQLFYRATQNAAPGNNTLTVPAGMDFKINLSDGSEIWLNSVTELQFPSEFDSLKREIRINGEAYLRIKKDASRPFIVHLPGNTVKVLGTEFNVNSYSAKLVKVSLVEGALILKSAKDSINILPGLQANSTGGSIYSEPFDAKKTLGWRDGIFYFEKANLDELSDVIVRWFGTKTHIDDPALLTKRFAGILDKNRPLASFLDNLKAIAKIDSYFDKDGVLHFK